MFSLSLSLTFSTLSCSLLHQRIFLYLLLLFVLRVSSVAGMTEVVVHKVKVPTLALAGEKARLECLWAAGDRGFYSVRWYKNGEQFYSYVPKNSPQVKVDHHLHGVSVVLPESNQSVVTLRELRLDSEGEYGCEVMNESPTFQTSHAYNNLSVVVLPKTPMIIGLQEQYTVGDKLNVTCIVMNSRPPAHLSFRLNGEHVPVPRDHIMTTEGSYPGVYTSAARLEVQVTQQHLPSLTVTCTYKVVTLTDQTTFTVKVNHKPIISFFNTGVTGDPPRILLILLLLVSLLTHLLTSC
ncbi:uncharacterized protein LOC121867833 [Homarus americanus]|uniref:uncharacterized protein LOC121867833 n=1 Tax=Homarus americanus TaxID=6706 RepID=UPI001C4400DE|nr:uncharacterized protein LOC121867833 [Homarus americanus]